MSRAHSEHVKMKITYEALDRKSEREGLFEDLCADGRILLRQIL
jgi:hypothetical protein